MLITSVLALLSVLSCQCCQKLQQSCPNRDNRRNAQKLSSRNLSYSPKCPLRASKKWSKNGLAATNWQTGQFSSSLGAAELVEFGEEAGEEGLVELMQDVASLTAVGQTVVVDQCHQRAAR